MLPTNSQVLSLHLFIKDVAGKKNSNITPGMISAKVAEIVKFYWNLAGFETLATLKDPIKKLLELYQSLHKNKSRHNPKSLQDREAFSNKLSKLFDVSHPELEKKLSEDRIRGNLGVRAEDLAFLVDQRGARMMFMGSRDGEYSKKISQKLKRQQGPAPSVSTAEVEEEEATAQLSPSPSPSPGSSPEKNIEYGSNNNKGGRSEFITVELPRDLLSDPALTSALDRTNTTSNSAMQIFSSVLKTAKKDGQPLDLNEVLLSRSTIERRRHASRDQIEEAARNEFQSKMPPHLTLHWDSKMLKDLENVPNEMEAIIVCGSPGYEEGKILG